MTQYRVSYAITRRRDGEDNFTEIGDGSSGTYDSVEHAAEAASALLAAAAEILASREQQSGGTNR